VKAFVLDPPRCTGCEACRVACSIENLVPMERGWRTVHHVNPEHRPGLPAFHLSLACNHCAHPACLEGCPVSAYSKDPATGAVLLDDARCIGCRYCSWVCPYDAPRFDPTRGVMAKCTFCQERLRSGRSPACAAACPTGALGVEEPDELLPEPAFPGLFHGGLGPALRIVGGAVPTAPPMAAAANWFGETATPPRKVTLRSEWTLWLFTLSVMTLVGLQLGWSFGGPRLLPPWAFLLAGALAAGLSASHLGRPERAWRALANVRTSWLSREVLGFGVFVPAAALAQGVADPRGAVSWFAAAAGVFLLVAMDRLYQVAERRSWWKLRSSDLLPAGFHLAALASPVLPVAGLLAVLRAALFLLDLARKPSTERDVLAGSVRLAALVLPVPLVMAGNPGSFWTILACFLAGEALDRAGFYAGFTVPAPAALLAADFTSTSADPA
jgi:Fe-S-cluster-containing dehydrogenase component